MKPLQDYTADDFVRMSDAELADYVERAQSMAARAHQDAEYDDFGATNGKLSAARLLSARAQLAAAELRARTTRSVA